MRINCIIKQLLYRVPRGVLLICQSRVEHVHGHVVSSFRIHRVSIYHDCELLSILVQFYTPYSVRNLTEINHLFLLPYNL